MSRFKGYRIEITENPSSSLGFVTKEIPVYEDKVRNISLISDRRFRHLIYVTIIFPSYIEYYNDIPKKYYMVPIIFKPDKVNVIEDKADEWNQIRQLLELPIVSSLKLDQFLIFELDPVQEQSCTLVLRAATGTSPKDSLVFIDNSCVKELLNQPGIWFIPDTFSLIGPLTSINILVSDLGGKSALIARIISGNRLWGFLVGYSLDLRQIDDNESSLFSLLASNAALIIENARLLRQSNFLSSQSMSLKLVSSAIVENKGLDVNLALIIDEAIRLLHAQDALVLLLEEDGEWFQVRERKGEDLLTLDSGRLSVNNSLNGAVVLSGKPLISQDAQSDPRADQERAKKLNVRSVAIAPLKIKERTIGTIAVHNKWDGYFSQLDLEVLCQFANQAAVAIENAQLIDKLLKAQAEIQRKADVLKEMLIQTMNIQESERQRIACDIHDRVVSRIVGTLYEVESCIRQYNRSLDINEKLQLIKQLLNEASEKTRTSIYNLWPATLEHIGLIPALRELIRHQEARTGVHHKMHLYGVPYKLKASVQIVLYRIVQEALNNAFQHSEASLVELTIRYSQRQLITKVNDNGKGFDVERVMQLPVACHFGLIGMRERVSSVGGKLQIISEPGLGSQIIMEFPRKEIMEEEGVNGNAAY